MQLQPTLLSSVLPPLKTFVKKNSPALYDDLTMGPEAA